MNNFRSLDLLPEEQGYELGVISRPFSPQLQAAPTGLGARLREFYYARQALADWQVTGVDVSYWQGMMDWNVAKDRISFAVIRAGRGNVYIDPQLDNNRNGCDKVGKPFGLYWYAMPGYDYKQQAASFSTVWKAWPGIITPVMDIEENGGLPPYDLEKWIRGLLSEFQRITSVKPMIYTSPGFWNSYMPRTTWAKSYKLWVAAWTSALQPSVPYDWKDVGWRFWQYSATGSGALYGAQSRFIDENRYNGNWAQFQAEFGLASPSPSPSPEPIPESEITMKVIATPHLNVRSGPGTNYADVGDLPTGTVVDVQNVAGANAWVQIKGGQFDGKWVCVQLNTTRFCEPSQD